MIFQNAFDHVLAPVDEYQLQALRNAALCGIIAFAFVIIGVNQLLTLLAYMFAVAFVCVVAWLYSLPPDTRGQVLERIRDVVRAFWRKCVDDTFSESPFEAKDPGRHARSAFTRREHDRGADTSDTIATGKPDRKMDPTAGPEDESRRIDLLANDFTGLFDVENDDQ